MDEVAAVRRGLGLDRVHVLGHSWGGALAAEYMIADRPAGVQSLVLSSPLLSTPRWIADANALREELPDALQEVLDGTRPTGPSIRRSMPQPPIRFYARHVRRLPVAPEPMCEGVRTNDTIYRQMWGPTEFRSTGSLRTWDREDDLDELTLPVLLIAGEFDEARPATLERFRPAHARCPAGGHSGIVALHLSRTTGRVRHGRTRVPPPSRFASPMSPARKTLSTTNTAKTAKTAKPRSRSRARKPRRSPCRMPRASGPRCSTANRGRNATGW